MQPSLLNSCVEGATLTDQRKHVDGEFWSTPMHGFDHPKRDQILPMPVAEEKQVGPAMADTIP